MQYRRLGRSGLKLSVFSYGSWVTFSRQVDRNSAIDLMAMAYERGVNFFDNAEGYEAGESEQVMGDALSKLGWSRDSYCVSSKVYFGGDKPTQRGLSRKHVTDACHAALRRLQVEYLDLYFCHRPDLETPIEETVRVMHDLIQQGKVLYWGTSEWDARQITEAYAVASAHHLTPPTMEQPHYNMFHRQRFEVEYLPLYDKFGLGTTTWSPLASGILTGKYSEGIPEGARFGLEGYEWLRERLESDEGQRQVAQARQLQSVADELNMTLTQLALSWCLTNQHVSTVILGATSATQLAENLDTVDHLGRLDAAVLQNIEEILKNKPEQPQQF